MKCGQCSINEGKSQICNGDGRLHHHGRVHTKDGGLKLLCDECIVKDREEWNRSKK